MSVQRLIRRATVPAKKRSNRKRGDLMSTTSKLSIAASTYIFKGAFSARRGDIAIVTRVR